MDTNKKPTNKSSKAVRSSRVTNKNSRENSKKRHSGSEIYEMLKTLKYDARDKLELTKLNLKITNSSLENELTIRRKLVKIRNKLIIREKFYKKKIYVVNKRMEELIFGKESTKTQSSVSSITAKYRKIANSRAQQKQQRKCLQ